MAGFVQEHVDERADYGVDRRNSGRRRFLEAFFHPPCDERPDCLLRNGTGQLAGNQISEPIEAPCCGV
jgi:hypothetical protein